MYIPKPLDSWAVIRDCGNFPCTGLYNVIIKFENPKFDTCKDLSDGAAIAQDTKITIISNNDRFSKHIDK